MREAFTKWRNRAFDIRTSTDDAAINKNTQQFQIENLKKLEFEGSLLRAKIDSVK